MPELLEVLRTALQDLRNIKSDIESGQPPDGERLAGLVEQLVSDIPELGPVFQRLNDELGTDHA